MASNSNTYLPNDPFFAFVNFAIGDVELNEVPPNHIISFVYDRTTIDSANVVQISVIDTTALALEFQLAQGHDQLRFSYGYTHGPSSKVYTARLTDYKLKFTNYGVQLDIEGVSEGLSSYGESKSDTYEYIMIHDIVANLAKEENWLVGDIEECEPVYEADGVTYKKFIRNNTNAVTFITNELTPYAKSAKTGSSGFQLSFDDSTEPPTVNYHPPKVDNGDTSSDEINFYEFAYGTGGDSRVISFEPNYSGMLVAVQGATEVEASTIDALRNEMFSVSVTKDTNPNVPQTGSKTNVSTTASNTVVSSSLGYDEATKLAATMWFQQANQSYGAIMEIVGDPNLDPQSMCSILIVNQDGLPHHSSGAYLVTQITDNIEGGSYTTTLQLFRNALNVGTNGSGGIDITLNTNDYKAIYGSPGGGGGGSDGTGSGDGGGGSIGSSAGLRAVVDKYIGLPYVWGGFGPKGYDCSGFVSRVYCDLGVASGRMTTATMISWGTEVGWDKSKIQPGDFIVYRDGGSGHVVLIIDQNTIAHAPKPGDVIKYQSIDYYWNYQNTKRNASVRRPPGVGSGGLGNNNSGTRSNSPSPALASSDITTNFLPKSCKGRPGTKRSKTTAIAWHWVGNPGSSASGNRNYFANCGKAVSSHYIIGLNGEILYIVPEDEIAYTTNAANSYSIGIECCHPDSTGKFNSATYNSMVKLGKALAKKYNLNPKTDFIRHYDVTGKVCPKYFVNNPSAWTKFKNDCC